MNLQEFLVKQQIVMERPKQRFKTLIDGTWFELSWAEMRHFVVAEEGSVCKHQGAIVGSETAVQQF